MRKIMFIHIFLLLLLAGLYAAGQDAYANDSPHDLTNNIDCATMCHVPTGAAYPWTTVPTGTPTLDDTSYNHQCLQCHNTGPSIYKMTTDAQNVKTHSSFQTSAQYGNWSIECRTCHDVHAQRQVQSYSISAVDTVLTGSLASFTPAYDTVTVTTATSMTPNAYYGYVLVPNKAYPTDYYRIIGNSINSFTVTTSGTLDPTYWQMSSYLDTVGSTFVVRYPNLVKSTVVNPAGQSKTVRFFNNSGPNSFATNTATIDGICQVCHTKTKYFTNGSSGSPVLDAGHPAPAGVNCTSCHDHSKGFKAGCTTCHGNPPVLSSLGGPSGLVSKGNLTTGGTGTISTGSTLAGNHAVHAVTKAIPCWNCHMNSAGSGVLHNNTTAQIKIGFGVGGTQSAPTYKGGTYDGQTTANYLASDTATTVSKSGTLTCGTVYCHSNAKVGTAVYSTASFSWNGAGPLACNACHGRSTPTGSVATGMPDYTNGGNGTNTANSHPKHVQANGFSCNKCHYQTTQDGVTIWAGSTKHVNGTIQDVYFDPTTGGSYSTGGQNCSATYCHGTLSPAWGSTTLLCNSCHNASSVLAGKHAKHYGTTDVPTSRPGAANNSTSANYIFNCSVCHDPGQTTHAGGAAVPPNQVAEVKFDNAIATSGGVTGVYTGGALVGADNGFNYTAGTCATTYCHSNGLGGAPNNTSFTWDPASTLACTGCHSYTSASGVPMASGSHSKHVVSYTFACNRCHNATTTDGVTIADRTKHVNHTKDVAWDTLNAGGNPYNTPNCANIYCHSKGTSSSSPYSAPNTAASWGSGPMPTDCTGCHNGDATSGTVMSSGTHAKHINNAGFIGVNFTCDNCHSTTAASGTSRAILSGANSHVNKQIDVRFTALNAGATYTNDGHAPNGIGSYSGCSSLYCHSNGKGTSTIVVWGGGGIGCNGCHGTTNAKGYPDYANTGAGLTNANSHFKHADPTTHNIGCQECHLQTTTNGTAIRADVAPLHINGNTQDVTFDTITYPTRSYTGASKTCSNISCHNAGGGTVPTPQWGATLNCTSCHGFPPSTGAHLTHVQSTGALTQVYGSTENKSVGATYAFGCGNCHPTANALHGNGTVTVLLTQVADGSLRSKNSTTAAYSNLGSQNGKCSAIYCHSSGNNTSTAVVSAASPSWGTTMSLAMNGNVCGGCHGNPPQYPSQSLGGVGANSHYNNLNFMGREGGHLITIHWDNVFSKATGSGLVSQNSTSESSHGNPGVATTMTCDICHNATVDSTTKDTYAMKGTGSSFECANCHFPVGTPTLLQSGAILDKSKHVNGSVDIQFKNASINSRAQLRSTAVTTQWTRNGAYGSAGSFDSTIQSLNSGTYNTGSKTCTVDCHNDLPVQWGDQTATCYTCHTALPQ